jgi:hypothetical protein
MSVIDSALVGNLVIPGVYVDEIFQTPAQDSGADPGRVAIVGAGSWGPTNTPAFATDVPSAQAAIGLYDGHANSILSEVLTAVPECSDFVFNRVTDGTDAAGSLFLLDAQGTPGHVVALTAIYTGTDGNLISAKLDLVSGTAISGSVSNGVWRLTVTGPTGKLEVFDKIASGVTYAAATFQANLLAAVNGTAPGVARSRYVVATVPSGSSTHAPVYGAASVQTMTGGLNGDTSITTALLLGQDGAASRTGIYVLHRAIKAGTLILAGCYDPTAGASLASFCQAESCVAPVCLGASLTTTDTVVAAIAGNNVASRFLLPVMDWTIFKDPLQNYVQRTVSPLGAFAGVLASITPDVPPLNQPVLGKQGILGTDRTISPTGGSVLPLDDQEKAERTTNFINWLGRPSPGGSKVYALWGLKASDGTPIADTRMLNWIALQLESLGGQFIGAKQSTNANDKIRADYENTVSAFLGGLLKNGQIADYEVTCDLTNNTAQTIQQGYLYATIDVTTYSGVSYVIDVLQVGSQVTISHLPAAA